MQYLSNKQDTGLQVAFEWAGNTRITNVPELPEDFDRWPGKYALDCDAGVWVPNPGYDPAPELARARSASCSEIDSAAEAARQRYITPGAGQAMEYLQKATEAEAFITANYPEGNLADYPYVQARANATGTNGQTAADSIIATRDAWLILGAAIGQARESGKFTVEAAADLAGVDAARDAALAALAAL